MTKENEVIEAAQSVVNCDEIESLDDYDRAAAEVAAAEAEIELKKEKLEEAKAKVRVHRIEKIKEQIDAFSISQDDLFSAHQSKKSRTPVQAKYRSPNGEEWSGRGLPPKWVAEHIDSGGSKDDLLINK